MHRHAAFVPVHTTVVVEERARRPGRRALRIFLIALLALLVWMILAPPPLSLSPSAWTPLRATAELDRRALPSPGACAFASPDYEAASRPGARAAAPSHASTPVPAGGDLPGAWPQAAIDFDGDGDPDPALDASRLLAIGLLRGQPPAAALWPALPIGIPNDFIPPRWSTS